MISRGGVKERVVALPSKMEDGRSRNWAPDLGQGIISHPAPPPPRHPWGTHVMPGKFTEARQIVLLVSASSWLSFSRLDGPSNLTGHCLQSSIRFLCHSATMSKSVSASSGVADTAVASPI